VKRTVNVADLKQYVVTSPGSHWIFWILIFNITSRWPFDHYVKVERWYHNNSHWTQCLLN